MVCESAGGAHLDLRPTNESLVAMSRVCAGAANARHPPRVMHTPSPPPAGVRGPGSGVSPCRARSKQSRARQKAVNAPVPATRAGSVRSRHAVGMHHLALLRRRPLVLTSATGAAAP